MTIPELFKEYPLSPTKFSKGLGMCKQQLNTYLHGKPISKQNLARIQKYIDWIGIKVKLSN